MLSTILLLITLFATFLCGFKLAMLSIGRKGPVFKQLFEVIFNNIKTNQTKELVKNKYYYYIKNKSHKAVYFKNQSNDMKVGTNEEIVLWFDAPLDKQKIMTDKATH